MKKNTLHKENMKVIVIGFDGLTWDLIKPWAEENELPTFNKLMKEGSWGELESTIPPVTFPAWKCYSTGKNPGKLGVFAFINFDRKKRVLRFNNSKSFHAKEIWDYLGQHNYRVGIIDMPTTYPPKKVNGFMIADTFSNPEEFQYVYPKEMQYDLRRVGYRRFIDIDELVTEANYHSVIEVIDSRFDLAKLKIIEKNYDFIHLTIYPTDPLQHCLWGKLAVKNVWQHIDNKLGEIISILKDEGNWNVFLMSDHGMCKLKSNFYMNEWLIKENYLKLKTSAKLKIKWFYFFDLILEKIFDFFKKIKIQTILKKLPFRLFKLSLDKLPLAGINPGLTLDLIDFNKSKAYSLSGCIYIFNVTHIERKRLCNEIKEKLKKIELKKEKILKNVYLKEEIYSGTFLKEAPDILSDRRKGYRLHNKLNFGVLFDTKGHWKANHFSKGIFLGWGKNIKNNEKIESSLKIYDLAPTILHIFKCPIPKDMDGNILQEILRYD